MTLCARSVACSRSVFYLCVWLRSCSVFNTCSPRDLCHGLGSYVSSLTVGPSCVPQPDLPGAGPTRPGVGTRKAWLQSESALFERMHRTPKTPENKRAATTVKLHEDTIDDSNRRKADDQLVSNRENRIPLLEFALHGLFLSPLLTSDLGARAAEQL